MILRSPAENENGGLSFHRVPSSTRHSRARGNPGLLRQISLDTRFRRYDGTQAGLFVLIPKRVFSKESTNDTKVSDINISKLLNFVIFVTFVVKFAFSSLGKEKGTFYISISFLGRPLGLRLAVHSFAKRCWGRVVSRRSWQIFSAATHQMKPCVAERLGELIELGKSDTERELTLATGQPDLKLS